MNISEINSISEWTRDFDAFGSPSFLQSWEWGEVQKKLGYEVIRIGLKKQGKTAAICQIVKIRAKRGNMVFVPHGPVCSPEAAPEATADILGHLKQTARTGGFDFIRIAPLVPDDLQNRRIFKELGFRTSPIYMHAERMWVLDLGKTEDMLLADMRKTTRYSIRKAAKEGVVIEKRTDAQTLEDFWSVYEETAKREHFTPFSKTFIQHEFEEFHKTGNALYLLGKLPGSAGYEAGALIVFTGSAAFYHQGASLHSKIPVAYLMQWEAIREAKKRGCRLYNFWGILQPGRTPKNWGGLTLFKQGFGGRQVDYTPTQDYVINPAKYALSYLYEQYLKRKRGV